MSYNIINAYLTPNRWSRPQIKMKVVKGIVVHWVANPNSTAMGNRNFFEQRKAGQLDYGSAHEIIDLNGDIVVCVPSTEITYNCGSKTYTPEAMSVFGNTPNYLTYGIECTHTDWDGRMTQATYNTLVERCADLCIQFKLRGNNLWLHKEVVGWKDCHRWFVNNPNEWALFKNKVDMLIQQKLMPITAPVIPTPIIVTPVVVTPVITSTTTVAPDWKELAMIFLKEQGFITVPHEQTEVITYAIFGYMMNNYLERLAVINPIDYLTSRKFLTQSFSPNIQLTVKDFAMLMMNRLGLTLSYQNNPIQFLFDYGFITQARVEYEPLQFYLFGAMLKNYLNAGRKI